MREWLAPLTFVFIWSTGFVVARLTLPHVETATFLFLRYCLATLLVVGWVTAARAPWPREPRQWLHLVVAGLLMHLLYMLGVFCAIERGLPAGLSSLIVSLQPLLTAILVGPLLNETVTARQWLGLALGLLGTAMVVWEKTAIGLATPATVAISVMGLLAVTAGTLWQKRFLGTVDVRSGVAIQYMVVAPFYGVGALLFETMKIDWSLDFVAGMAWAVLALSVGAHTLLYWLIKRGSASRTAALFYLVPPTTAVLAFALFGETFGLLALAGMVVAVAGVALAVRKTA